MYKTFIYPLNTSSEQNAILEGQSRVANKLYNWLLSEVEAERINYEIYKFTNFNIFNKYDIRNRVPKASLSRNT